VFISLYRALQNLIAENKLNEPFLWIPDLEGPVYKSAAGDSTNWFYSIFSGTPALGWDDTRAFLTLPVILFISQSISTRILQPPRDPNKVLTEQEQFSQGLVNNLPFIVAFFSLNVPAGLGIYWITNNILTTIITLVVKASLKDEPMPAEVAQMMAALDAPEGGKMRAPSPSSRAMMKSSIVDESKTVSGFGSSGGSGVKAIDVEGTVTEEGGEEEEEEEGDKSEAEGGADDAGKKRKKRIKPSSKKDGKKK
jgi:YidC/Oxa1 family membrane protein insertase